MGRSLPKVVGPYKIVYKIGSGSFSEVYQGFDPSTGALVALKFIDRGILKDTEVLRNIEREIRISERVSHKNIVNYKKIFFLDDFIVLSMECLGNGTIAALKDSSLFAIDESVYLRWGKDILEGLKYLHEKKIAHHDIKPENIGFDKMMNAKILDIGLCEEFTDFCYNKVGTPFYGAPEILLHDKYDGIKADIWSFGVTFHYMVTGLLPFKIMNGQTRIRNKNDVKFYIKNYCTSNLKEIIDMALTVDPKDRPTADDLLKLEIFDHAERCGGSQYPEISRVGIKNKPKSQKNVIVAPIVKKHAYIPRIVSSS